MRIVCVPQSLNGSGCFIPSEDNCSAETGYGADLDRRGLDDNTNGLPTSEANDIAETGDGFIWIGSYSGLIRYDGKAFERMYAADGIGSVVRLYTDSKDRLRIGTNDEGIAMLERGALRKWDARDGLSSAKIRTIAEDEAGRIFVGTTAGIFMLDEELQLRRLEDPRIADAYLESMFLGADGLF